MITDRYRNGALLISSALALGCGGSALAQESDEARSVLSSADIVVTARRVEERLQDVPISITVFNQDQITKQNIVNTSDLALYTPGLGSNGPVGSTQATFSLRGFNQENSTAPTVGIFFADVVAPRAATPQSSAGDGAGPGSFFDLQNVQVLKGPQGTLFGRNTTGGAILLVPQKPTGDFGGYIEGNYGNYDMWRLQGVVNVPLGDRARARIGVDRQQRDGYVKNNLNIGPSAFNDVNYLAVRASLVVDLTPDLETYTIASYAKSDTVGEANSVFSTQVAPDLTVPNGQGGTITIPGAVQTPFAFLAQQQLARIPNRSFYSLENNQKNPFSKLDQRQIINTTTWRASDSLTIKNIISYAELTIDAINPVFAYSPDLSDFNPYGQAFLDTAINPRLIAAGAPRAIFRPFPAGTTTNLYENNPRGLGNIAEQSTFTEELQFQGSAMGNRLTWQAGAYYEDSRPLSEVGSTPSSLSYCPDDELICSNPFFGFGGAQRTGQRKRMRTVGVYGQASYDLTEQVKITGGIRYTWDRQEMTGSIIRYSIPYSFYTGGAVQTVPVNTSFVNTAPVGLPSNAATCLFVTETPANDCLIAINQKSSAPTWLLGLDFKPADDVLTYAKWSRGYRTGGLQLQLPQALRVYDPEKVDTYEVGLKATLRGPVRGSFNLAAFYNDFSNQQISVGVSAINFGTAPAAQGVVNAGKSRIWGVEVESSLELFRGFVASVGYTYLDTKITRLQLPAFNDAIYFIDVANRAPRVGDSLPFSAKHKFLLSAAYTLPLDQSIGELSIGANYSYTAKQITTYLTRDTDGNLNGFSYLQPRNLVDVNLSWKGIGGSPVDLGLFVNNLLKDRYFTYVLDANVGITAAQLGQPRMYGLRIRYNFGK